MGGGAAWGGAGLRERSRALLPFSPPGRPCPSLHWAAVRVGEGPDTPPPCVYWVWRSHPVGAATCWPATLDVASKVLVVEASVGADANHLPSCLWCTCPGFFFFPGLSYREFGARLAPFQVMNGGLGRVHEPLGALPKGLPVHSGVVDKDFPEQEAQFS